MPQRSDFTDDTGFRQAVGALLGVLLDQVDELDDDELDPRLTAGNLSVTFEDESVILLSQQTPTHELWLSANYTAWHFLCIEGHWVERDTGEPILTVLSKLFSEKLGESVSFSL
ncbi:MAG: iron donor protein CyaY [Myxococcota bacterium]|nr:iron donor protein CyaY [Myxococcota bacterium]